MADNPHIGGSLPEISEAVSRLEKLTQRTEEVVDQARVRAERMQQRLRDLEARLERNAAKAEPYRVVEQYESGQVAQVRGYAADKGSAQAAASGMTPNRGKTVSVQENPAYDQAWANDLRQQITSQREAYKNLNASIRGEAAVRQQIADQALVQARAEQEAASQAVSAEVAKARAMRASALAQERTNLDRAILPAAGQTANMPVSPFRANSRSFQFGTPSAHPDAEGAYPARPGTSSGGGGSKPPVVPPAPPTPPTPPPPPAGGGTPQTTTAANNARRVAISSERQLAEASQQGADIWRRNSAAVAGNSDALRRHGALTTEFIEAAARGQASYREWGYQIGATAGKFAGWTAVSIPVFAAIDGVAKIGKGAIASADGVNQLQRVIKDVDTGQAQDAFRSLSREFNVAPEVAARAVYLAGQRFHDLPSAVNAATASLYAFKTGELAVDDAAKGMNAIAAAFGLSGAQIVTTFDQINQAQNQLGASIPDLVTGMAKAGGAFKNAGGDASGLLALLAAGKATGRTGDQVATAVQRSAGYVLRPSNQAALRGYGIDPNQAFYSTTGPSIVGQAISATRGMLNRPGGTQDIQKLAAAISSPQFASIFVPILRNSAENLSARQGNLNRIAAVTSPGASSGSASTELRTLLSSPKEQFAAFGNELQRLGSAIGESGLLGAVTRLTLGMTGALAVTERSLSILNGVPGVLQQITFIGAGLGATRALGRRLGAGENSTGLRNLAFGRTPEQSARLAVNQSLRDQQEYIRQSTVGSATRARTAGLQQDVAARRLNEAVQRGPLPGESRADTQARVGALQDRLNAAKAAGLAAEEERAVLDQLSRDQLRLAESLKVATRAGTVLDLAVKEGIYVTPSQDRPAYGQNPVIPGREYGNTRFAGPGKEGVNAAQTILPGMAGPLTRDQALYEANTATQGAAFRMRAYTDAFKQSSGVAQRLGVAAQGVRAGALGATRSMLAAGTGLRAAGAAIYGMIGPLGLGLIGIDLAIAGYEKLKDSISRSVDEVDKAASGPDKGTDLNKQIDDAIAKVRHDQSSIKNALPDWVPGSLGATQKAIVDADVANANRLLAERSAQRRAQARGQARPNINLDQFNATFKDLGNNTNARVEDYNRLLDELTSTSDPAIIKNLKALQAKVKALRTSSQIKRGTFTSEALKDLSTVDITSTGKDIDNLAALMNAGAGKTADAQRIFNEGVLHLAAGSKDTSVHGRAAYQGRVEQIADSIEKNAHTELDRSLATAKGQDQRDQAYTDYFASLREAEARLRRQLAVARKNGDVNDEARISKALRDVGARIKEDARAVSDQRFEEQQAMQEARAQVNQYNYAPGTDRDKFLLADIGRRVNAAVQRYGRDSSQALALIQQQRQAEDQLLSDQLEAISTDTDFRASQTRDPVAQQRIHISGLQKELATLRADPRGSKDANKIKEIQTQINEAYNTIADQQQQDAVDLLGAIYAYRESLTEDPVEQARLEAQRTQAVVDRGGFKNRAEKLRALADRNTAATALRNASVQGKENDIEFDLSMERISTQDAIDRYNNLLKTRNLGKAERRQIQQRVHDLLKQQDSDATGLDLDVGSLKLPTIYDVRRAFDPIRKSIKAARDQVPDIQSLGAQATTGTALRAGQRGVAMSGPSLNNNVTFNISVTDPNAAGEVFHHIDRAMKTTVKAKMKSRGHRR